MTLANISDQTPTLDLSSAIYDNISIDRGHLTEDKRAEYIESLALRYAMPFAFIIAFVILTMFKEIFGASLWMLIPWFLSWFATIFFYVDYREKVIFVGLSDDVLQEKYNEYQAVRRWQRKISWGFAGVAVVFIIAALIAGS